MTLWSVTLATLKKDIRLEWRSKDALNSMLFFSLLVVVIFSFSFDPNAEESRQIAGGLIWVAFLFAAVVAKPDSKWGEVPCAFIELKENARATEAEIIAFCRSQMSGFKTPKAVVFGPIPKTSTGKIQKFLLRNQVNSAKAISA